MSSKTKGARRSTWQGGDGDRIQIRDGGRREAWQALADYEAGAPDAPLGAFLRAMIELGIRTKYKRLPAGVK